MWQTHCSVKQVCPFNFMLGLLNYCTKCNREVSDCVSVPLCRDKNLPERAELFQRKWHSLGDDPCCPHHTWVRPTLPLALLMLALNCSLKTNISSVSQNRLWRMTILLNRWTTENSNLDHFASFLIIWSKVNWNDVRELIRVPLLYSAYSITSQTLTRL